MGVTVSAIGEYFSGAAAADASAAAAASDAGGGAIAATTSAAAGGTSAAATYGTVAPVAGGGLGSAVAQAGGTALATGLVGKALAPSKPGVPPPIAMPDPLAQEAARQQQIINATVRRGRASTILSQPGSDVLGG